MNAVPAAEDITAKIPRNLMPANEAELSRDTHKVINTFNGMLEILQGADWIRKYPPTSRIPNGRVWGPYPMNDHPGWEIRFTMTRDPNTPEYFAYSFEVHRIGTGDSWILFIQGTFVATGGARQGMGTFRILGDGVRNEGWIKPDEDGNVFKELSIMYSTAAYPISVSMTLKLYPQGDLTNEIEIVYHYEEQETGQAAMQFFATDSSTGGSIKVTSRWLASGAGRADAEAQDGMGAGATWTQCWNESFVSTYQNKPWAQPVPILEGYPALCPDISTL